MATKSFRDGRVVTFDEADGHLVGSIAWCPTVPIGKPGHCYATGWVPSLKRNEYMHRLVTGAQKGQYVDHINGDTLDNRRENLRVCSATQNNGNANWKVGQSGYRGVCFDKRRGTYFARIAVKSREINLGAFQDPEEAARRYDEAAINHFGEFATLNFPREAA